MSVERVYTATVVEYMGNYFQTAGNILRLVFLLHEVLLDIPSPVMDSGSHLRPTHSHHLLMLIVNTEKVCNFHHSTIRVLTGASVFGKLFAFVAFIFVYKILITSFIV